MATSEGGETSGSGGDSATEEKAVGLPVFEHSGWVYHLGINSIKREYCHRRFLHIKGKHVMMYKRNPHEHPGTKPIRRGVVGHTLVLEELGCRKVNDSDLYVLKFSNRLDEEKKGEIACATADETRKWMEALEQAKKQAEYELFQSSNTRNKLSMENEIDLERHGHRRRVKRYANGLKRLINTKHAILQFPAVHKKQPPKSGYRRTKINASTWEIKNLSAHIPDATKCLVTHMLEVQSKSWTKWKTNQSSKFEKTVPYALLSQVSGLKAYFSSKIAPEAKSTPKFESCAAVSHKEVCSSINEFEDDDEVADDFYDAISAYSSSSSSDDDSDYDDTQHINMGQSMKQAVSCVDQKRNPVTLDHGYFPGSMLEGKSDADTNCWMSPSGNGFMIRGKTYLKDSTKVPGGEPFLKLIAVDWFKVNNPISNVALHPKCLVQSEAGKKLPFVLVMNLQVPAKPNYSLVLYFAADKPVMKDSLLGRFIDETNTFRDSRFKLIPSIVEGYWMVKRAVGTKACLLGKAVSCNYVRQDNFLEIDVDVGSSSVARSIIGIVLGYVTSIVVDLAILIEAKEQELPEYILGTVRLNRVRLESAVLLES